MRAIMFLSMLTAKICAAASPAAADQSVADYKPPVRGPLMETTKSQPASEKSTTVAALLTPRVPPKILLTTANGFVTHEDRTFVFVFTNAPLPEVIAAVASVFRATVIYSGSGTRAFSGEFRPQTLEQALSRVVDGTNLRYVADGRSWIIREWNGSIANVPLLSLSEVLRPAEPNREAEALSATTASAATASR